MGVAELSWTLEGSSSLAILDPPLIISIFGIIPYLEV